MADVIICGGGIIGCSVAYYLAKKGIRSQILERAGIACAASGKAGGFLARDWGCGTDIGELSMKSFDLHMELMQEFSDCDYRRLDTLAVTIAEGRKSRTQQIVPPWVDGIVTSASVLGNTASTAQVHPFKLCHTFAEKARELAGTEVKICTVEGVEICDGKIRGVKVSGEVIPASTIVLAMGPWSGMVKKWLNTPDVRGQKAHSVILRPKTDVTPHALFLEYKSRSGRRSPEIYPRPDGTVYACGMSNQEPLPDDPTSIKPTPESCDKIVSDCRETSSYFTDANVEVEQACYLPVTSCGVPIIGKVPSTEGVYIATGHSCWGILNAPATGAALAELIVDAACSMVDLSPFDPARFMS